MEQGGELFSLQPLASLPPYSQRISSAELVKGILNVVKKKIERKKIFSFRVRHLSYRSITAVANPRVLRRTRVSHVLQ